MNVGGKIKELRKERNMTASQLADIVGITRAHLSGVENNLKPVSFSTLNKICEALGITMYDLFCQDSPDDILTKEQKSLLEASKHLTDTQMKKLSKFLDSLKSEE